MEKMSRRQMVAAGLGTVPLIAFGSKIQAQQPMMAAAVGLDPFFASCLLIKGHKQIEVCRFALERLKNEDVKKFANAEIEEHEGMKKKLAALGYMPPAPANAATGINRTGPAMWMTGRYALPAGISDVVAVDHEVGEQCIVTTKSEQGKLQGLKFEKAFVGSQLHAHYGLFDHGVTYKKHATRELGALLDEAKTVIEQHIATCKTLMDSLEAMKE